MLDRRLQCSRTSPLRVLFSLAVAACGCDGRDFDRVFSTPHFDYFVEHGAPPPCAETADWLERHDESMAGFLGVVADQRIQYYLYTHKADLSDDGCSAFGLSWYSPMARPWFQQALGRGSSVRTAATWGRSIDRLHASGGSLWVLLATTRDEPVFVRLR